MTPTPSLPVLMVQISRLIEQLLRERAHCQIVITMKDGALTPIQVNRSFLPGDLPKV